MTRIAAVLIVLAGLGGWLTPSAAQKALKTPSFRAVADVYGTPNLFRASVAIRVRPARGPSVDNRAVFVVPAAAPGRASWSTTHLTGLPARVSWTGSHTALASVFAVTLLIDAAQTRELARQGWRSEERRVGKECGAGGGRGLSSRRRHTRSDRDWSSDVCSSDLNRAVFVVPAAAPGRASWSTTHLTGLPARVSWTGSHTALASVFAVTLLIDAAQTRELARQGW